MCEFDRAIKQFIDWKETDKSRTPKYQLLKGISTMIGSELFWKRHVQKKFYSTELGHCM